MKENNKKIFKIFEDHGLGLDRNEVRLVEHNKEWKKVYNVEAERIYNALNLDSLKLYHCGSTSIPEIVAKPILDIVGTVNDLSELDAKKQSLIDIGYMYKGEYGIKGRRFSVLYNLDKTIGYCHLHLYEKGKAEFLNEIIFRNYLRANPIAAKRYENVKKALNLPRNEYSKGKEKVISELLEEAKDLKK